MPARNGSTVRLLGLLLAVGALVAACSTTEPGGAARDRGAADRLHGP
jgi:hypothetical protein